VVLLDGSVDEDEIMLVAMDAGADDLVDDDGTWRLTCEATDLPAVREALEEADVSFLNADVTMLASTSVVLDAAEHARAVLRVMEALDDNDDVQDVHANFDISAEILEALDT
jgi:transcriptional/translational regulatory protein YebC/TACO1